VRQKISAVSQSFGLASLLAALSVLPCLAADDADSHFRRAQEYRFAGSIDAAILEYRKGLNLAPNDVQMHDQLGQVLLDEKGDVDGAISEFMTALRNDPNCSSCEIHLSSALDRRNSKPADEVQRGNQLYLSGDYNRAAAAYRVAIHNNPADAEAHNSLAWTLYKQGKIAEGITEVNLALKTAPTNAEYVNTLACLLFDKGDIDGAINVFKKAIALSKKPGAADLYGLAIGYLSKGDTAGATKSFAESIKTDPKYEDINYLRDRIGLSINALATHDKLVSLVKKDAASKDAGPGAERKTPPQPK
jgi:tetratricopeptide (TPR) repeat protein